MPFKKWGDCSNQKNDQIRNDGKKLGKYKNYLIKTLNIFPENILIIKAIHIRAERDILVKSNFEWIVELKYSF
jgi:hypothetical protein